jgi:hypothetical protein
MAFLSSFYPQPVVAGTTEGTFAEGNHSHELDELDASGIASGKVLTANGLDAASWEDPTGEVEEAPEDATPYARKDGDWTPTVELEEDGSISAIVQVRQGTAAELGEIVLNDGEIAIELEDGLPLKFRVGDGATSGGNFPSITNWTIIEGTSDDNQSVTNSSDFIVGGIPREITFFKNAAELEAGSYYEFFGQLDFNIDGLGGVKLEGGTIFDTTLALVNAATNWQQQTIFLVGFNLPDVEETGIVSFSGRKKITSATNDNKFIIKFAQSTATSDGILYFRGQNSYVAYRKII